jgi:hypothetical protein
MADTPKYGNKIESYKLPAMDCQEERRNFPGYEEKEYYTLDEIRKGDQSGITETDSKTSGKEDGEYSTINKKSGKPKDWSGKKLSTETIAYASDTKVNDKVRKITNPQVGNTMNRGR